jgi:hypothetical protein
LLNTREPYEYHYLAGGLASPPDSRYNSPIFPLGQSSKSATGNLSPLQCINPRDLFDSRRFFMDRTEYIEEDDSTEQEDRHLVGCQSYLKARSRNSSIQPSSPPASSEYHFHANQVNSLDDNGNDGNATAVSIQSRASPYHQQEDDATLVSVGTVKLSLNSLEDDAAVSLQSRKSPSHEKENAATMVPVQSREASSHPQDDDDATMVPIQSREASSHPQDDDDATMVPVQSREASSHPQDDDDATMVPVQSSEASSHPQDDDDATMVGVSSRDPSPDPSNDDVGMVGVQRKEPSPDSQEKDDPLGPMSDLSDLEEDNEGRLTKRVKSQTSGVEKAESDSNFVVESEEPPSVAKGKSPDLSDQDEESVRLAAELGLRRSARNVPSRKKSAVNYAGYAPSRKLSTGRRKPAVEKDVILVEASIQNFPSNMSNKLSLD